MVNEPAKEELFIESLSKTYNKDFFFELGRNLLTVAQRYNHKTSLLYISIENFTEIMKFSGESSAENLLKSFCQKLKSILRESDFLAQLSSNSFGVLVPETDAFGALLLMRRIENAFIISNEESAGNFQAFHLNIATATAPGDGKTIPALIGKINEKLGRKRKSLAANTETRKLNFLEIADFFAGKKFRYPLQDSSSILSQDITIQHEFSSLFIDQVQKCVFQDVILNRERHGVLFIGIRNFTNPEVGIQNYHALKNIETTVYVIGLKGKNPTTIPYVIPVYLSDEKISSYRFIFFLCDKYAYGLIGKEESKNRFSGFHSSDFYFIEHIISKLQQDYFY